MSKLIDGVFYASHEANKLCAFCGHVTDTRPYGPDGKQICVPCAAKPEYKPIVDSTLKRIFKQAAYVVDTRKK